VKNKGGGKLSENGKGRDIKIIMLYSATKSEILSFTGKWMELENIILSEVSQAQKVKNCSNRPKTNAVILLDIGHPLRGECTQEE
jgi:hypothetical protein